MKNKILKSMMSLAFVFAFALFVLPLSGQVIEPDPPAPDPSKLCPDGLDFCAYDVNKEKWYHKGN